MYGFPNSFNSFVGGSLVEGSLVGGSLLEEEVEEEVEGFLAPSVGN